MKNILKLKLYGYTVRGIDRRDGADFEDHIVISDSDADLFLNHYECVRAICDKKGFDVHCENVIPDRVLTHDPERGITVELDLGQLYLEKIKLLKEQQNEPIASIGRK